jgi:hypothetical protein
MGRARVVPRVVHSIKRITRVVKPHVVPGGVERRPRGRAGRGLVIPHHGRLAHPVRTMYGSAGEGRRGELPVTVRHAVDDIAGLGPHKIRPLRRVRPSGRRHMHLGLRAHGDFDRKTQTGSGARPVDGRPAPDRTDRRECGADCVLPPGVTREVTLSGAGERSALGVPGVATKPAAMSIPAAATPHPVLAALLPSWLSPHRDRSWVCRWFREVLSGSGGLCDVIRSPAFRLRECGLFHDQHRPCPLAPRNVSASSE